MKKLFTTKAIAEVAGVSQESIRKRAEARGIRPVARGLWSLEQCKAILAKRQGSHPARGLNADDLRKALATEGFEEGGLHNEQLSDR